MSGEMGAVQVAILVQEGTQTYTNLSGLLFIPFKGDDVASTFYALAKHLRAAGFEQTKPSRQD